MEIQEWKVLSGRLFASFTAANITEANLVAYYAGLADQDVRDVELAVRWFTSETDTPSDFPPSLPVLLEQIRRERAARLALERLPDFTGSSKLPPAELEELLEAGIRASAGAKPDDPDARLDELIRAAHPELSAAIEEASR